MASAQVNIDKEKFKEHYKKYKRVDFSAASAVDPTEITYTLFRRENPEDRIPLTRENIRSQKLDGAVKTILLFHGWTRDDTSPWYESAKQAYFLRGNYNIVFIDWSKYSKLAYPESCSHVLAVGKVIAEFLVESAIPPQNIHLLGHSLGSQVAAFVGKAYRELASINIGRITALDPAGPKWSHSEMGEEEKLNGSDADFVDVVHTDIQAYGYTKPCGRVDYYPNGGTNQPGCPDESDGGSCNHRRATSFFIESISTKIDAIEIDFEEDEDFNIFITPKQASREITFGEHVNLNATGVYYFETNSTLPFLKNAIEYNLNNRKSRKSPL